MSRNNLDASQFYSGRKKSRWKSGNALLSFGAESVAFHLVIQKYEDESIQNYKFVCFFFV